jgi:sulfatase maturation enzyme AslB (radical SAM superfamily)
VLGRYPEERLVDVWRGARAKAMRETMTAFRLPDGCSYCAEQLRTGTVEGLHARYFDEGETRDWPTNMEFHLSNLCNLQCVMCYGFLSSSIRKHRDKLPRLESPYGLEFVKELEEFIPHLKSTTFLGGEPFLNPLHFEIWNRFKRLNPDVLVHVITNGTILNKRIIGLLDRMKFGFTLSIDTLNRERYESIRVDADFDQVMRNFEFFLGYSRLTRSRLRIAACPMQQNWMDLPQLLEFCDRKAIVLTFNPVLHPPHASLRSLEPATLVEIADFLARALAERGPGGMIENFNAFAGLVQTLRYWSGQRRAGLDRPLMQ